MSNGSGRVETLARSLLRDGYVDNEADARLAAIKLLLARDQARRSGATR